MPVPPFGNRTCYRAGSLGCETVKDISPSLRQQAAQYHITDLLQVSEEATYQYSVRCLLIISRSIFICILHAGKIKIWLIFVSTSVLSRVLLNRSMKSVIGLAVGLLCVFLVLLKKINGWYIESTLEKTKRSLLPPGDFGWPVIGNMLSFLKAFKSDNPDSFIDSYANRYVISLSLYIYKLDGFCNHLIIVPDMGGLGCTKPSCSDVRPS